MTGSGNHSPGRAKRVVLARRTNAGIRVALLWTAETNAIAVHVHDARLDDEFELDVQLDGRWERAIRPRHVDIGARLRACEQLLTGHR
jgi:hypothetical protein